MVTYLDTDSYYSQRNNLHVLLELVHVHYHLITDTPTTQTMV